MKVKVAVLQYDVPEKTGDAVVKLDEMVENAAGGAGLIVAPETAIGEVGEVKETGVDYLSHLTALAKKHGICVRRKKVIGNG